MQRLPASSSCDPPLSRSCGVSSRHHDHAVAFAVRFCTKWSAPWATAANTLFFEMAGRAGMSPNVVSRGRQFCSRVAPIACTWLAQPATECSSDRRRLPRSSDWRRLPWGANRRRSVRPRSAASVDLDPASRASARASVQLRLAVSPASALVSASRAFAAPLGRQDGAGAEEGAGAGRLPLASALAPRGATRTTPRTTLILASFGTGMPG